MSKGYKVKNPHKENEGAQVPLQNGQVAMPNYTHPVFCFKYLDKHYGLEKCTADEKLAFLETISKLSTLEWKTMRTTHRHGLGGSEKIHRNSIRRPIPSFVTPEVDALSAYRFQGKKPFLAYQNKFILHIIFIDRDYTVYKHS